ncbi:hypothetical protein BDV95DRAFT_605702 [Massariosphaeria phaeospora]|uniref:Uncharacterized protein n=1 Tax=Massariosphaeria phaeospora TaxID=100035 RepID=A0A7C8MAD0_9PLEO|nr:hypothetical protein BDV95DRAFT_605702 [Massariosphaeria phaeospora]
MDKIKDALHIRRKSKSEEGAPTYHSTSDEQEGRHSYDSELESMTPDERVKYLKDFDDAERSGIPKKGSLLERLIERGNKRTAEQLAAEERDRQAKLGISSAGTTSSTTATKDHVLR